MTKKLTPPPKARRSSFKVRSKKPTQVSLVATKSPLRHLRLVSHAHSGKVVHRQHTSHVALMLMLVFVGVMLALSQQMSSALTSSGSVTVGAVVNGPPPTVGAEITSPIDGAVIVDQSSVPLSGTCAPSTFVVVKSNNVLVGSTNCTVAGIFALNVDLEVGENVLTALNFDNVNQPGPATSAVRVTLTQSQPTEEPDEPLVAQIPALTLPDNPSLIPGLPDLGWWCDDAAGNEPDASDGNSKVFKACEAPKDCDSYTPNEQPTSGGPLSVSVVCVPRILEKNQFYKIGLIVRGGFAPYALNIDWGSDDKDILASIPKAGYSTVSFRYANVGPFNVKVNVTDTKGEEAAVETAVQVNGQGETFLTTIAEAVSPENWFTSPVPLYVVAVVMTLAFWGGDIFDRRFGSHKRPHSRGRKRAA